MLSDRQDKGAFVCFEPATPWQLRGCPLRREHDRAIFSIQARRVCLATARPVVLSTQAFFHYAGSSHAFPLGEGQAPVSQNTQTLCAIGERARQVVAESRRGFGGPFRQGRPSTQGLRIATCYRKWPLAMS